MQTWSSGCILLMQIVQSSSRCGSGAAKSVANAPRAKPPPSSAAARCSLAVAGSLRASKSSTPNSSIGTASGAPLSDATMS
jgi:hypothetical protein